MEKLGYLLLLAVAAVWLYAMIRGMIALSLPEHDGRIGPDHPLPVGGVDVDGGAVECPAPFDNARVVVRVGKGDAG